MDNEAKMLRRNRRMTYDPDACIKVKREPMFEPILEEESSEHRMARDFICDIMRHCIKPKRAVKFSHYSINNAYYK